MNIERFRKIIVYSDKNRGEIYSMVKRFCAFAGMLLMPEVSFRRMYSKLKDESCGNEVDTIIRLMSYYQVPHMAVLIRCLELELIAGNALLEQLCNLDRVQIKQKLADLWLDERIMDASNRDNYSHIEIIVERLERKYIGDGYINERTLKKVLHNMREQYMKIKGGVRYGNNIY